MFNPKRNSAALALVLALVLTGFLVTKVRSFSGSGAASGNPPVETAPSYSWTRMSEGAAFPGSYNFSVFVAQNRMWAFHHEGVWHSADGRTWTKSSLPSIRRNVYVTRYVQFNNAIYALGQNQGNYRNISFGSTIRRTTDFKRWETLAGKSELPNRIFYGLVAFNGKIWLLGGFDGQGYYNDVWNSSDGAHWARVVEHAAWSPRNVDTAAVFKNRIWVIGGGLIDGTPEANKNAGREIWSSADGVNWALATDHMPRTAGGSPIVFEGKLWLVGANRDGSFARASLVTDDGVTWREESAPWSPRGAVAVWVYDDQLFMTGGKYSVTENGNIRFIYSNDVWRMSSSRK
jgi:hypothetical protein